MLQLTACRPADVYLINPLALASFYVCVCVCALGSEEAECARYVVTHSHTHEKLLLRLFKKCNPVHLRSWHSYSLF